MNIRKIQADLGNPQKEYRYTVSLPFDPDGRIAERVIDVRNSLMEMTAKQVRNKNRDYFFATGRIIGDLTLTLLEDEQHQSLEWLEGWQAKIINKDETVNPPFSYIAPIEKIDLSSQGFPKARFRYLCFPSKPGDQFSRAEGGDKTKLVITFKVVNYSRD